MLGFFKRSAILTASSIAMAAIGTAVFSYFQSSHLYTEMPFMANLLAAAFTSLPAVAILAATIDAIRPERPNEVENQVNQRARNRDDDNRAAERNQLRVLERAAQVLRQQVQDQRGQIANLVAGQRQQERRLDGLENRGPTRAPTRSEQQRQEEAAAREAAIANASSNSAAPAA